VTFKDEVDIVGKLNPLSTWHGQQPANTTDTSVACGCPGDVVRLGVIVNAAAQQTSPKQTSYIAASRLTKSRQLSIVSQHAIDMFYMEVLPVVIKH